MQEMLLHIYSLQKGYLSTIAASSFRLGIFCFPKKIGKDVDDDLQKFFADSLSLIGKLFEIYFVRLIGTPNQQFKINDPDILVGITLVVQNH